MDRPKSWPRIAIHVDYRLVLALVVLIIVVLLFIK